MEIRRRTIALVSAGAVLVASVVMPAWAWARYSTSGAETNDFATHVLLAVAQPTCSGLGVLSITLNWSAPSDSAFVTSYNIGSSRTSGGPYGSYVNVGLVTSKSMSVPAGDTYYVVQSVDRSWTGPNSPERHVQDALGVLASCP